MQLKAKLQPTKTPSIRGPHLADTMTASPSLHLSAGMDLRHCLDRRKRPGKNTDPAARMVSMVPGDPSERQKVQQAIWSLRSVALLPPSLKDNTTDSGETVHIDLTGSNSHIYAFAKITDKAQYQSPTYVSIYMSLASLGGLPEAQQR